MFKLQKIELRNRLIAGFPPSEIQLGLEGYLLREDLKVQWQISRFTNPNWLFGLSITFIAIFILIIGFPILLSFSGVVWPVFVGLFLFLLLALSHSPLPLSPLSHSLSLSLSPLY